MSETPTPRTDAATRIKDGSGCIEHVHFVAACFARQLELELAEAVRKTRMLELVCIPVKDALLIENRKLAGQVAALPTVKRRLGECHREINRLGRELSELRKDKERLDWLDAQPHDIAVKTFIASDCGYIREAIDAARKEAVDGN